MKRRSYLAVGALVAALVAVLVGALLATSHVATQQAPTENTPRAAPRGWIGLQPTDTPSSGPPDDQGPAPDEGPSDDDGTGPQAPPWVEEDWIFPPKWGLRFGNAADHASGTAMAKLAAVITQAEHPGQGKMLGIEKRLAALTSG